MTRLDRINMYMDYAAALHCLINYTNEYAYSEREALQHELTETEAKIAYLKLYGSGEELTIRTINHLQTFNKAA